MTQLKQILYGLGKIGGRGTCGQIAAEIRLSRTDVEKRISALVTARKVKVLKPKGGHTITGRFANIYSIRKEDDNEPEQIKMFEL